MKIKKRTGRKMPLTEFEQKFKNALLKLTNDTKEIYSAYLCLKNDEERQRMIDRIENSNITTIEEVDEYIGEMYGIRNA